MADAKQAAESAEGKVDIVGHLLDGNTLDVPFIGAHHVVDGHLNLPTFPPIEVFGFSIDLSITRHVLIMWVACALLVIALISAFRRPNMVPSGLISQSGALRTAITIWCPQD